MPKIGHAAHHPANALLRVGHGLRIARAVGQKNSIGLEREYIFRGGGRRNDRYAATLAHQSAQDVVLDAVVVGDDVVFRRRIFHADNFCGLMRAHAFVPLIHAARGDFLGEVSAIHLRNRACLRDQLIGVGLKHGDNAAHDAVVTQMAHQRARVDFGEHGNLVALQILFRDLLRAPVGADPRELAHDQALDVGTRGFVVVGVGAVIADFRIGEDYDLAGVGGVGENFLVSGDRGVKNNFPVTFTFSSVAFAAEDPAIFQRKDCLHCISGEWILMILSGNEGAHKRREGRNRKLHRGLCRLAAQRLFA